MLRVSENIWAKAKDSPKHLGLLLLFCVVLAGPFSSQAFLPHPNPKGKNWMREGRTDAPVHAVGRCTPRGCSSVHPRERRSRARGCGSHACAIQVVLRSSLQSRHAIAPMPRGIHRPTARTPNFFFQSKSLIKQATSFSTCQRHEQLSLHTLSTVKTV